MQFVIEGIFLGLILAVSMGPIFVALTQASIARGATAGFAVGFGVWVSDIIIVIISLFMIKEISEVVNGDVFQFWMGVAGVVVLTVFGIILIAKKPDLVINQDMISMSNFMNYWMKGFLINTINPFTFIFWLGTMSTYKIGKLASTEDLSILLFTILTVIILSDSFKVILAKLIRNRIEPKHVAWISKISGAGLIGFASFLLYQIWYI
jgi:threonine/homoserine/homoserine lactone efflux protein